MIIYDLGFDIHIVLIGAVICAIASINVNSTFKKYSRYSNENGMTAEDCASYICKMRNL